MEAEDYVSYGQAVELKGCGFDRVCRAFYGAEPDGEPLLCVSALPDIRPDGEKGRDAAAPSLAQAAKWLREAKGMNVYPLYDYYVKKWYFHCGSGTYWYVTNGAAVYPTYEAALSAGIDAALEMIKDKRICGE